jgi:serine/threonine-protein kinase
MTHPTEILADRWQLIEKIDAGAMGEIFRGAHSVLGHPVAIKVLMPEIARDKVAIDRFLREARIAAKLRHRNVVRVEDFGVAEDGRAFLVMELLRGESLARRLERPPPLRNGEVLEIVRQIGAALDVAHGAGIIHRDLKPENIFLASDEDGRTVKVLDFGVAKFTDVLANGGHATTSNTLVGTPRYMSPEQARSSRQLDGRSDLWALGMLTYEMLTGTHPFEGEAIAELLVAILTHRIPSPSGVRADLPESVDVWIERALARNRAERFSSGLELSQALEEALDGRWDGAWAAAFHEVAPRRDDTPRRGGTVRIQRPSTATPVPEIQPEPTPVAAEGEPREADEIAVTVADESPVDEENPPSVPDDTPRQGIAFSPRPNYPTPQSTPGNPSPSRTPWWIAAVIGLAAGIGLIVATRFSLSLRDRTNAVGNVSPAATAPPQILVPPVLDVQDAAPQTESTLAPVQAPSSSGRPAERTRHRHRRNDRHRPDAATTPPGGLYDPVGI